MSTRRRRIAPLLGVALLSSVAMSIPHAAADEPPTCFGRPATIWGSGLLEGTPGDDVIVGSNGEDVIYGYEGNDFICGLKLADTIYGGPGDDHIRGGLGKDVIDGGEGVDVVIGGVGKDTLSGGPGNDRILGNGHADTISGDAGDDEIVGHNGNDLLMGGDDQDELRGGKGDDEMHGGPGDDLLQGGNGDDYLFGDEGDDLLQGRGHHDLLYGGSGVDRLRGNAGADELWAGECVEIGNRDNHFCRAVPSGRVTNEAPPEEGDLLFGDGSFDSCNGGEQTDCETERDWRGSPWDKSTAEEWRDEVTAAFTAFGVEEEIEHALQIIACESLGDPFQVTQVGSDFSPYAVAGLFQHMLYYWDGRASASGVPGMPPYRPDINVWVAAWMVMVDAGGDPWHDWVCDEILIDKGLWE
jgi:hypothetical protein